MRPSSSRTLGTGPPGRQSCRPSAARLAASRPYLDLNVRWLHAITATQDSRDTNWASTIGTYKSWGDRKLLSFEAIWNGVIGSNVTVADYGLQSRWSQPLYRPDLTGEVLLGHFWPKPDREIGRAHV